MKENGTGPRGHGVGGWYWSKRAWSRGMVLVQGGHGRVLVQEGME